MTKKSDSKNGPVTTIRPATDPAVAAAKTVESRPAFKSAEASQAASEAIDGYIEGDQSMDSLRELLIQGRNLVGWKEFGRMLLEELKSA